MIHTLRRVTVLFDADCGLCRRAREWVLCLWRLAGHRGLAMRLAGPALLPTARKAVLAISARRQQISGLLDGLVRTGPTVG